MRKSEVPGSAWTRVTLPGGVVVAFLLALWAGAVPEAGAQGAEYVEAYNVLVQMLNDRQLAAGRGNALPLKSLAATNASDRTVTQVDLNALRIGAIDLMRNSYLAPPEQYDVTKESVGEAFPFLLSAGTDPVFTKIPAEYTSGGESIRQDDFTDVPLLWVHFQELYGAMTGMTRTLRSGQWTANGESNRRYGEASYGWDRYYTNMPPNTWGNLKSGAYYQYSSGTVSDGTEPSVEAILAYQPMLPVNPSYWLMVQPIDALARLTRVWSYYRLDGLYTGAVHRVAYYDRACVYEMEPEPGMSDSAWTCWGGTSDGRYESCLSPRLGEGPPPAWPSLPNLDIGVSLMARHCYVTEVCAVVQWEFDFHSLVNPGDADDETDGLVSSGCECRECLPGATVNWTQAKDKRADIAHFLGETTGTTKGGVRLRSYIREFQIEGVECQQASLDTRVTDTVVNNGEGWGFATVRRPSGADMTFALAGTRRGQAVGTEKSYRLDVSGGDLVLDFKSRVRHRFSDGRLVEVNAPGKDGGMVSIALTDGRWPGLDIYKDGAGRILSNVWAGGYSVPVYSNGLVEAVTYYDAGGGFLSRVGVYKGSRIVRVFDAQGNVTEENRLVPDSASGAMEVWNGVRTGVGVTVARKSRRWEEYNASNGVISLIEQTVYRPDTAGAETNRTEVRLRDFPWGRERVGDVEGDGGEQERASACYYYTNAVEDGANYGRLALECDASGGWSRYTYDASGRVVCRFTPLKTVNPDAGVHVCRVETHWYAGDPLLAELGFPAEDVAAPVDQRPRLTVEMENGVEVGRTWHAYLADRSISKRCVSAGARYDAPDNLVSDTVVATNGPYAGREVLRRGSDGMVSVVAYDVDAGTGGLITTVETGAGGDAPTSGVRVVTRSDFRGRSLDEQQSDLETGITTGHRIYWRDAAGRAVAVSNVLGGTVTHTAYGCCGPDAVMDEDGVETRTIYDDLKQVYAVERLGVTRFMTYDVRGSVVKTRQSVAGMLDSVTSSSYDAFGRLVRQVDAQGTVVKYAYGTNELGEAVVTTTQPDGATSVETSYLDGRTKCVTGTAVRAVCYDYGADGRGRFTVEFHGPDTNATSWVKTWQDMLGRTRWVEYADGYTQETLYDGVGRVVGMRDGFTRQVTEYNGKGEAFRSGVDMDGDGVLAVGGSDRMTEAESGVGVIEGKAARWSRNYGYAESGSAVRTLMSESWQSLDGTRTWSIAHGSTNRTQVVRDAARATRGEVTTYPDRTQVENSYTNGLLKMVRRVSAHGDVIAQMTYEHDALGRTVVGETTGPNGQTIRTDYQFDVGGKVTGTTTRAGGSVRSAGFRYDEMGRRTQATLVDGTVVRYSYKPTGELAKQAGSQTYPVEYDYDAQGRMVALSTFRDGEGGTPDVTRWLYDERRGWVNGKVYADGTTNRYQYRQDGRLERRESARGIETRYGYDAGGVRTNTVYSDGTPPVGVVVDRLGRAEEVMDGMGARGFRYDVNGVLVEETLPGAAGKVEYGMDVVGRRTNLVVSGGASGRHGVGYGYDEAGRLAGVAWAGMRADYTYAADGASVAALRVARGDAEVVRGVREYDDLGSLRTIDWLAGTNAVAGREYDVNSLGQRTRCGMRDGTYWEYGYDELGQLISAGMYTADGAVVSGRQYEYAYDTIGNRSAAVSNGVVRRYTANGLNQYERWEGEGGGSAVPEWQGSVYRFGGRSGGVGKKVAGKQADGCKYDADGNMTSDGVWSYAWDAENRLMMVSNATKVLTFAYDYMGRRTVKKVYTINSESWLLTTESSFIYDGWNVVREVRSQNSESRMNQYVWGLDLSGTLGGAGGIGGLVSIQASDACLLTPVYDGNGNVTALVDTNGAVAVSYEYDPFGNLLSSINHQPSAIPHNPFTFSTKYCDEETGLSYYGYRYYSPGLGRWLSRDPMEESGGVNLYGFVGNDGVNGVDPDGRAMWGRRHNADTKDRKPRGKATLNLFRRMAGDIGSVIDLDVFRSRGRSPVKSTMGEHCQYLLTINGIWNSQKDSEALLNSWQEAFPDTIGAIPNAGYVYNPTTYVTDFLQIGFLELGAIGLPSQTTAKYINQAFDHAKEKCCSRIDIYIIAHSQGAAVLNQALALLPADVKKTLRILTIGAEQYVRGTTPEYGFTANINSEGDLVPDISPRNWFYHETKVSKDDVLGHPHVNYRRYFEDVGLPEGFIVPAESDK